MHKQQNSKSTDSLAPKENSPSENSPAHGNTKIVVVRARMIFWEERFAFLGKLFFSRAVFCENNMEIMCVLKDPGP